MKRALDFTAAFFGLLIASPVLIAVMVAIWLQDFASPFYVAPRMARGGGTFRMIKFRSMVVNADKIGGVSTAGSDRRITPVGQFVRRYKIDELIQLWNVLIGQMSLVGPRPQVKADADLYTDLEKKLLSVLPGITDLASIVFADEGEILRGAADPDLRYNQIIRPWKSRLALLYIEHSSPGLDVRIIWWTALALISREAALRRVQVQLDKWGADKLLREMAGRNVPLQAYPPPGATTVFGGYTSLA